MLYNLNEKIHDMTHIGWANLPKDFIKLSAAVLYFNVKVCEIFQEFCILTNLHEEITFSPSDPSNTSILFPIPDMDDQFPIQVRRNYTKLLNGSHDSMQSMLQKDLNLQENVI